MQGSHLLKVLRYNYVVVSLTLVNPIHWFACNLGGGGLTKTLVHFVPCSTGFT